MDIFSLGSFVAGFFGKHAEDQKGIIEGFSKGHYYSLNCSKFVGDNFESVQNNLNLIKQILKVDNLITLNQIHSNKCIIVDESTKSDLEADAMVTTSENIALGILTADCTPILFCDPIKKIIGASHGGWKGVKSGIHKCTVETMLKLGCKPSNIHTIIGPCIHRESYEVDQDFLGNFPSQYFTDIGGNPHFDIVSCCIDVLKNLGLTKIMVSATDTYKAHDRFFSYRYAKHNTNGICGRNISVICNNPKFRTS